MALSPTAYALLRSTYNICREKIAGREEADNFGTREIDVQYNFHDTNVSELVLQNGFYAASPSDALEIFHASLQELVRSECLDVEGDDGNDGVWRKRPLQIFAKAAQEFGAQLPQAIDPDLHVKFNDYMTKKYLKLANTKICLTERGVQHCHR